MLKLGVLGSTRGSALQPVIDAIEQGKLDAEICLVISNKADAPILARAAQHHLPHQHVSAKALDKATYDQQISQAFNEAGVELILLVGYMRILSKHFVDAWSKKVINVHPSLLPKHAGLMDLAVHQSVLDAGEKESGCTIHYVEEIVDNGEIIIQKQCVVDAHETAESLKAKVQQLEGIAFIEAIKQLTDYSRKPPLGCASPKV